MFMFKEFKELEVGWYDLTVSMIISKECRELQLDSRASGKKEVLMSVLSTRRSEVLSFSGDCPVLLLLDLRAALDIVDHAVLTEHVEHCFSTTTVISGIPQGSILRPVFFFFFTCSH